MRAAMFALPVHMARCAKQVAALLLALVPLGVAIAQHEDPPLQQALEKVNSYRHEAGLSSAELDETLSAGCLAHCRYMSVNNPDGFRENPHDEVEGKPHFSPEGRLAARNSPISYIGSAEKAVDEWMSTMLHRIPLLRRGLKRVGIGMFGRIIAMDCQQGIEWSRRRGPVLWPPDKASGIPVAFNRLGEVPSPVPGGLGNAARAGYPVTIQFVLGTKIENGSMRLLNPRGQPVRCYVSTPQKPLVKHSVTAEFLGLIPRSWLKPGATYTVVAACTADGKLFRKTWSFTTERHQDR